MLVLIGLKVGFRVRAVRGVPVKDVLLHDGATDAREGFRREALELFLVDLFLDADILPHPGIPERREHALERPFFERLELRGRPEAHDPELELHGLLFAEQFRLARFGETPDRKLKGGDFKPDRFRLGRCAGLDLVDLFGNAEADEVDLALAGRNLGRAASTSSSEWTGNVTGERFGLTRFGMESSSDFKNDVGRAVNVFFKLAYAQHFPTHFVDDERGKLPDVVIAALRELVEYVEAFFEILGDHGVPPF